MSNESTFEGRGAATKLVHAACVVLLRERSGVVETLLTRRQAGMYFGGLWVFAGGKVDAQDREAATAAAFPVPAMRQYDAADAWLGPAEVRAFFVAAARELAEETGVCVEAGPGVFVHFAHWVTPPHMPQRFDTHFFLAAAPAGFEVGAAGGEVAEYNWVAPRVAVEASVNDQLPCAPVTVFTLLEVADAIERHGSLAAVLAAERDRDVLPIMPKLDQGRDPPEVLLPWHPRYHEIAGEGTCAGIAVPEYYREKRSSWTLPASLMPRRPKS